MTLARIVEGEQLRDDAAHGMAADDRLLDSQMIEQCRGIVGEHFDRVFLYGLARFSRAAVVEHDDSVIARKFRDLVKFPGLMIETGDAAEQKRRAIAVNFVVDLRVLAFEKWHKFFFSMARVGSCVRLQLGAVRRIDALDKAAILELAHNAIVDNVFRFDLANLRVTHFQKPLDVAQSFEGRNRLSIDAAKQILVGIFGRGRIDLEIVHQTLDHHRFVFRRH